MSVYRDQRGTQPNVLVCSGLDPSGGAGFIADVRVVAALGVRPIGVITAMTVQNTIAVQSVQPVDSETVGSQLASVLGDIEVHAVKVGLIGSVQVAKEISFGLDLTAAPLVWDPVGAPSRGRVTFDAPNFGEMLQILSPHLRLVTPNLGELAELSQFREIVNRGVAIAAAQELIKRVGELHVLVKGGHWDDREHATDLLVGPDKVTTFEGPRIGHEDVHGTGCALSTAIATHLALGKDIEDACRAAKEFVAAQIAAAVKPGRGAPAVV